MTTIKEQLHFRHEVVDRQLAHVERDRTRRAYDRADFLDQRRVMMQKWADYLDEAEHRGLRKTPYGVRCWSFWQDLSQLQRIYPFDWKSIVNNCAVQQYFGLSMPQAASEIDAYLGGASPRPIAQIAEDDSLLLRRGHPAQIVRRPNYLRDAEFAGTFSPNPFFGSTGIEGFDLEEVLPVSPPHDNVVVPFPERGTR
jgi:hypothetical protein